LKLSKPPLMNSSRDRERALARLLTSTSSSTIGFFLADLLCQCFSKRFSILRLLRFGIIGGFVHGLLMTSSRNYVQQCIPGRDAQSTAFRVALELLVLSPAVLAVMLFTIGKFSASLWLELCRLGCMTWSAAHILNFLVLPRSSRLAFFNITQMLYNTILSTVIFTV
jgi:hypothetical protein